MDFKSWPGHTKPEILKAYKFKSVEEAKAYKLNPVDTLEPLAKAGIAIIHVVQYLDKQQWKNATNIKRPPEKPRGGAINTVTIDPSLLRQRARKGVKYVADTFSCPNRLIGKVEGP